MLIRGHRLWVGIALATSALAGAARGQVSAVIGPGAPADFVGPGVVFDQAAQATIDSAGRLLFIASVSGPGIVAGDNNFIIVRGVPGSFQKVVQSDQAAPQLGGDLTLSTTGTNSPISATMLSDDAGNIFFSSLLQGTGVSSSNDSAAWFGASPSFPLVLREGSPLPDLPATLWSSFPIPRVHDGVLTLTATISGAGVTTSNDVVLTYATPAGAQTLLREGDPVPTLGGLTTSAFNLGATDEFGRAFFRVTTSAPTNNQVLFLGTPGNISRVLSAGEQAADLPASVVYTNFSALEADGQGKLAFASTLCCGASGPDPVAVFFGQPGGIRKVMTLGDAVPGLSGVQFGVQASPQIAASHGTLIFRAKLTGTGVTTSNDDALFMGRNGVLTMIVREGTPVPGLPGVNYGPVNFQSHVSREGAIVFQTPLTGAVGATNNEALFARKPDGSITRLMRKGDSITLSNGQSRTVTQFFLVGRSPNSGLGRSISGGRIVASVNVLDPGGGPDQSLVVLFDIGEVQPFVDPAWTIPTASESNTNSGVNGTSFEPRRDIDVVQLGYYDDLFGSGEGLNVPHQVGIYHVNTMELVVQATVPEGTAAPRENLFRYVDVPPTRLLAGEEYIVAAVSDGDNGHNVAASSMSVGADIILGTWRLGGVGPSLDYPNVQLNTTARFMGPSFQYRAAPDVPACPADLDNDGSLANGGTPDGAITIDDLLFFLGAFEAGDVAGDLDGNGVDPANPDGAVTVDDLLFFLIHFEGGC